MIKKIAKRVVRDFFGYEILNKKTFGLDIIRDIKNILGQKNDLTIFDIGANIGDTSIEFASSFAGSSIHAFEPDSDTYIKLKDQVSRFNNIATYNFGFGKADEHKELNVNRGSGGNSFLEISPNIKNFASGDWVENIGKTQAAIKTVNHFCNERKISRIDIVKIDTQGYEMPILEGGDRIINADFTKVVYIEVLFVDLYSKQSYFQDVYTTLFNRGFKLAGLYNTFRKVESPHYLLWCDALFLSDRIV